MKLGDVANGRDNNFNLIRLIAALSVLVTHSFAIATGDPRNEPLRALLGMTIGDFAVDAFFVTSGFLVTASLATRQSALDFVCARVLRIYPALLVMLALTVLVAGPLLSTLPAAEFLTHRSTLRYLAKCATLIFDVDYRLPGLFDHNPYKAVNGSLWSMPWELRMYVLLLAMWVAARLALRRPSPAWAGAVLLVLGVSASSLMVLHFKGSAHAIPVRLLFMFFTGASYYLLRGRVVLSGRWMALAVGALLAASLQREAFFVVYCVVTGYCLLWLAYVPSGPLRRFNRLGDYSYGTYIYAFPIQQITAMGIPGISPGAMIVVAGAATLIMAVGSWHLIEARALKLKSALGRSARYRAFAAWPSFAGIVSPSNPGRPE
jgi:peptidoglycan/LPS O-acetylase OafA/YrhL